MKNAKQFEGQHDDEEVIEVFRKHPVVLRKGLYGVLVGLLLGLLPALFFPQVLATLWAIPAGFLLGLIAFFYYWIGWYFSLFIVTDQRFMQIKQKGLFKRSVVDIGLDKIQNVNYEVAGLQQTMLGFGTVVLQTFVGDLVLDKIHHPAKVQTTLLRTIKESGIQIDQTAAEAM